MSLLLSKAGSTLTVKVLLDTLQQTIEFETSMSKKWATDVRGFCHNYNLPLNCIFKVIRNIEKRNITHIPCKAYQTNLYRIRNAYGCIHWRTGQVSCPSLSDDPSLIHDSRALSDMLAPHRGSKARIKSARPSLDTAPRSSTDGEDGSSTPTLVVLPSSTELFYFYGQNLEQCAKLSRGTPLADLATLHKKWLKIYAG